MRFGIEIEFGGSRSAAIAAIRDAGLSSSSREFGYIGNSDTEWVVKSDGSVPNGGELVSPPLDFENEADRDQVDRAVAALVAAGCTTSQRAGIHVHIESRSMTAEQLSNLARTFAHFEDTIYRLATSGWRTMRPEGWSYAKPLSADQKVKLARAKTDEQLRAAYYGSTAAFASGHGHHSRYCGLNLHSHFYRGTVEFRVFNSSLNPMRVRTYIAICHALVVDAKSGKKRSIAKAQKLGDMAAGRLDEKKAIFAFLGLRYLDGGLSLADYRNVKKLWADSRPQTAPRGY